MEKKPKKEEKKPKKKPYSVDMAPIKAKTHTNLHRTLRGVRKA